MGGLKIQGCTQSGVSFCHVDQNSYGFCSLAFFSTNGTSYQKVCGKARGYQKGHAASFWGYSRDQSLDSWYVEGLSITYDTLWEHIWTYDIGRLDNCAHRYNCPCAVGRGFLPPPFVGPIITVNQGLQIYTIPTPILFQ